MMHGQKNIKSFLYVNEQGAVYMNIQ